MVGVGVGNKITKTKAKANAKSKAKDLPDDLAIDIIGQFSDPKSLCRFKSISKSWCSLIAEIKRGVLVFVGPTGSGPTDSGTVYSADLDSPTTSLKEHPVPEEILERGGDLFMRGTCNGLIVFETKETIFIWSKFIGDYQVITSRPRCYGHRYQLASTLHPNMFFLYGFGYDSVNDDYKLVDIVGFSLRYKIQLYIYSFRHNTWSQRSPEITTKTTPSFPYFFGFNQSLGVLVGSVLNWVAYRDSTSKTPPYVFAFDLTTEEFHEIELPEKDTATVLGVLEGCLTVTHSKSSNNNHRHYHIWVMKEYMVKESWTLVFRIHLNNRAVYRDQDCIRPLAASSRNGNKILLGSGRFLLWYDLENDKLDGGELVIKDKRIHEATICFWPTTYVFDWQSVSRFLSSNREEESIWKRKGPVAFCRATQNYC